MSAAVKLFSYLLGLRPVIRMYLCDGGESEHLGFRTHTFGRAFELWRYYRRLGFR